jgi:glycerol dehydrogenase
MPVERRHPRRYLQGPNVSDALVPYVRKGSSLVVSGERGWRAFENAAAVDLPEPILVRHASMGELTELLELLAEREAERIVALGGGRAIDVGKACASIAGVPSIVAPTILSTDAACSSVSVLYDGDGKFERYVDEQRNPSLVVVDTNILRKGPTRYGCAGIVGALAVFFEAEEVIISGKYGGTGRQAQHYRNIARSARRFFLAMDLSEMRQLSSLPDEDFEDVVHAALWTSADLFENVGLSLAHSVYRGLRGLGLPELGGYLHGELVGLGLICQLRLLQTHKAERSRTVKFVRTMLEHVDWRTLRGVVKENSEGYERSLASFQVEDGSAVRDATLASLDTLVST